MMVDRGAFLNNRGSRFSEMKREKDLKQVLVT